MEYETQEERKQRAIRILWKISKVKTIEDKISIVIDRIPNIFRKMYCLFGRICTHRFYKQYVEYNKRIRKLHNKHKGERCIIVGHGPSLNKTNFDLIRNENFMTVGCFFKSMHKFRIKPKYWCVTDMYELAHFHKDLLKLDIPLFLTEEAGKWFLKKKDYYMKDASNDPIVIRPYGYMGTWDKFSKDLTKGAYGGTVILSCLQIAYYLGFKEVYLIGCDCDSRQGRTFIDGTDEFSDKIEDNLEGWKIMFERYKTCKKAFEEDGRKIYNATVGGRLEVFERKRLEEL